MISRTYDLVVVGGGTAGCMAGRTAAELGCKVCIIDRKKEKEIGDKVCGDAVGKHHFDDTGISPPGGNELASAVSGIDVLSPDLKTAFKIRVKGLTGFIINRLEFGQRLLNEALDAGVDLFDRTLAVDPILKNDSTVGVKVKDLVRNKPAKVYGRVVVDASGVAAVLRRKMPARWAIKGRIDRDDAAACYEETREVSVQIDDPEILKIHLCRKIAPGGYYWVFPKGDNLVNVGMGVQMTNSFPDPKKQLYEYVLSQPLFKHSKKIREGSGLIPTRRPVNLVGNGILFAGDSACQTNPAHGSGIGPSMRAGKMAAQAACRAIWTGDVSRRGLWSYNKDYTQRHGVKYAGLDVYRILLQKCDDEAFNFGMANNIITGEQMFSRTTLYQDLESNNHFWLNGKERLPLIQAILKTSSSMKRIRELYKDFPQPEGYSEWVCKVDKIIAEMKEMDLLDPNPHACMRLPVFLLDQA